MAEQQGKYLARCLNAAAGKLEAAEPPPFAYKHLGSMASVGECRAGLPAGAVAFRWGLHCSSLQCPLPPHSSSGVLLVLPVAQGALVPS